MNFVEENFFENFHRLPSPDSIHDYTFHDKVDVNNCEIEVIGTFHNSEFSKEKIDDRIDSEDFDVVCLEMSESLNKYNQGELNFDSYLEEVHENSQKVSTRFLIRSLLTGDISKQEFEEIFGIGQTIEEEPDMFFALNKAKSENINYEFVDLNRPIKDSIRLDEKSNILKIVLGFFIRTSIFKTHNSPRKNYPFLLEQDEQKLMSKVLSGEKERVLDNLIDSERAETNLHISRDKHMCNKIINLSKNHNKILLITGLGHYKNILEKLENI